MNKGWDSYDKGDIMSIIDDMSTEDRINLLYMLDNRNDESSAKEIVSDMYHTSGNKKYIGEKFDMHKAKEVFERYKSHFVVKASPCDVYVAINAAFHDFGKLLKSWFGSNIDEKIILLAITFWFKDDDYQGNKLLDYFE
jgi:hypothetical protein